MFGIPLFSLFWKSSSFLSCSRGSSCSLKLDSLNFDSSELDSLKLDSLKLDSLKLVLPNIFYLVYFNEFTLSSNFFIISNQLIGLFWEEALVEYNMHFKRYGSFGVLVQPERKNTYSRQ